MHLYQIPEKEPNGYSCLMWHPENVLDFGLGHGKALLYLLLPTAKNEQHLADILTLRPSICSDQFLV